MGQEVKLFIEKERTLRKTEYYGKMPSRNAVDRF
jgi:hypothetical protein